MHKGMQCYITPLWVNPSLIVRLFVCSFVRLFFFSHSLDCISCSHEEMCDTPIGTTSWSPAKKWNGFEEDDLTGAEGVLAQIVLHWSTTNLLSTFFSWFMMNLIRWIQKSHWFCSIKLSFFSYGHMSFFTFLFTCTHVWNILEVSGGKMPCRIIVLIGNDHFNDKK